MKSKHDTDSVLLTIYLWGGGTHKVVFVRPQAKEISGHLDGFLAMEAEEKKGKSFFWGTKENDIYFTIPASYIIGYYMCPLELNPDLEAHRKLVDKLTDSITKADDGEDWKEIEE